MLLTLLAEGHGLPAYASRNQFAVETRCVGNLRRLALNRASQATTESSLLSVNNSPRAPAPHFADEL
jgi:hypothetical protein